MCGVMRWYVLGDEVVCVGVMRWYVWGDEVVCVG